MLDMAWKERDRIVGDDIWFTLPEGIQVIGNQIQIADIYLSENQNPLAKVEYGRGNCGEGYEGARSGNVIYTSCIGPMLVKNPRFAEQLLKTAAEKTGVKAKNELDDEVVKIEDEAFKTIKEYIEKKMNA